MRFLYLHVCVSQNALSDTSCLGERYAKKAMLYHTHISLGEPTHMPRDLWPKSLVKMRRIKDLVV